MYSRMRLYMWAQKRDLCNVLAGKPLASVLVEIVADKDVISE